MGGLFATNPFQAASLKKTKYSSSYEIMDFSNTKTVYLQKFTNL